MPVTPLDRNSFVSSKRSIFLPFKSLRPAYLPLSVNVTEKQRDPTYTPSL